MHKRDRLLALVRDGETVSGAARQLEIPRATVYSWKARHQDFSEQLSAAVAANSGGREQPVVEDWREVAARLAREDPLRWGPPPIEWDD